MRHSIGAIPSLLVTAFALPEIAIQKKSFSDIEGLLPKTLQKRAVAGSGVLETNPYSVLTWASGGAYFANVTIGTPPQEQVVILDTGSSDLYFDAVDAPACKDTSSQYSCRGGTFNPSNSKTYEIIDASPAFNTSFVDGSTAYGPYAIDTFGIGDVSIPNVQFAVAEQVKSTTGYAIGLMGVGYSTNEASSYYYPNVPEVLRDAGVIDSRLYSIYLNDVNSGSGSILFGGVDTTKFKAPLATFNLLPDPYTREAGSESDSQVDEFITTVTDLNVSVGGKTSTIFSGGTDSISAYTSENKAIAALLDTGSSAWTVPASYYSAIMRQFSYVDKDGFCPCTYRDSGDTLNLVFGGKLRITVPAQEFIVPVYNATTRQPYIYDQAGNTVCSFMISEDRSVPPKPYLTLGDAVLRSMYVVFDLDNGQVSLAQANVNSTQASNVVKIPAGANGVASAVSGASSAPEQTWSVAAPASATQNYIASTVATTIGTATGSDAVPTEARVVAASKGAAATVRVPGVDMTIWSSVAWALCMAVSALL